MRTLIRQAVPDAFKYDDGVTCSLSDCIGCTASIVRSSTSLDSGMIVCVSRASFPGSVRVVVLTVVRCLVFVLRLSLSVLFVVVCAVCELFFCVRVFVFVL